MPGPLSLLLRLEARRLSDVVRHPRPGAWLAVLLPAVFVVGGLWAAGESARPDVASGDGRMLLGLLVSAAVSLQAYPVLFRPADDGFLRRLGIPARASFHLRAIRLLVVLIVTIVLVLIPFVSTGAPVGRPLGIALGAGIAVWAVALWSTARAGEKTVDPAYRPSLLAQSMAFDRELVRSAPLVFAPMWPFVAGGFAAAVAGMEIGTMPLRLLGIGVVSILLVPIARRTFERGLPRFAPHTGELAYAPPPEAAAGELVIGRGVAAVLPRRAGAVRARDALVVERRYRWAARAVWPVAVFSVLALVRAGADPAVRGWVATACGVLVAAQMMAVIALGRSERGRVRWIDRATGLGTADRLLGRWASAFGLALGVTLPVALAWSFTAPAPPAWWWLAGAALAAAVASAASVMAAGR